MIPIMERIPKMEKLKSHLEKLLGDEFNAHDSRVFQELYAQFISEPATIDWNKMRLVRPDVEIDYDSLQDFDTFLKMSTESVINRVAVVKLNGGLGTTMGCKGPKSLIELRDGLSFLDFVLLQHTKLNQKYKSDVPLILVNSFNTNKETAEVLKSKPEALRKNVRTFVQNRCPRIYADTLMPVPEYCNDRLEDGWYPPGHGNVFESLAQSGLLDQLLKEGREIAFFSNIDNTGACFDMRIAKAMCDGLADYIMEVTPKTEADIKGGTLIELNGSLMHLEMPQVPADKIDEFCSLKTFKMFNTNNIWVNLRAVKDKLGQMTMEILANKKKLADGQNVIQLETSIGGAIRNFEKAISVRVNRRRFLPIKSTQELLALMSNCYYVDTEDYVVKLIASRSSQPLIKLSSEFSSVDEFLRRFASIPDLSELKSLKVIGDVKFGKNVKLVGNCEISSLNGETLAVADDSVLGQAL
ncbi:UTP--glucose-1-phosphate uridylyltransferase domain-containing protein [Ditylenchus destructor]|nr:UTP--glucose-1-phosphate uridylyltransferase domain-containing protein [Ditylenchus destructor]